MCNDKGMRELLPLYGKDLLEPAERDLVDRHVRTCEDCRAELKVLQILSAEAVPDPGEAFWASMPGRVRRGIDEERVKKTASVPGWLGELVAPRRLAWSTAAIAVLALVSWHLYRPVSQDIPGPSVPGISMTTGAGALFEPLNVAELTSDELAAASRWAQNAIEPIREAAGAYLQETDERSISDDLSGLSSSELDRLNELLKNKEQEAREKLRKRPGITKSAG